MGNKVGKAIEKIPYVLYSLIGEMPIGGQSIEGASGIFCICSSGIEDVAKICCHDSELGEVHIRAYQPHECVVV